MARSVAIIAAVILTAGGGAARSADQAAAPSLQAIYDQAQSAFDKGDWGKAIPGFEAVLARSPADSRSMANVRSRLAEALLNTGQRDQARVEANRAITAFRAHPVALPDYDLADAYLTLGGVLQSDLDYAGAIAAFKTVPTLATGADGAGASLTAERRVVLTTLAFQPDLAASTADGIISAPSFKDQPKQIQADVYSMLAIAKLNQGDANSAKTLIEKALSLSGGVESTRVNLLQVAVRANAALIYAKLHDERKTHELLANTGAGHLPDENWLNRANIDPPVCGPDISPDDTAVVEFSISEDGRTLGAQPIYVSRPGKMGVAFASAVGAWTWRPEAVARLDPFWRLAIRVQLRCVLRPPPLTLSEPFSAAARDWLRTNGVVGNLTGTGPADDQVLPGLAASTDLAQIPAAFRRLVEAGSVSQRDAAAAHLEALLNQTHAPPDVRALAADSGATWYAGLLRLDSAERARRLAAALPRLDQVAGGERAAAWLRTEMAVSLETAGDFERARPPLEAVVALPDTALPGADPIRQVAILHLSLLDRRNGQPNAARALLESAGLTSQKCDLLDVKPIPTNRAIADHTFPEEAEWWGFEGWVRESFDVAADGSVKNPRTVFAYPPFIFDEATEKAVARFRYMPPTLGDTALGCTGQAVNVHFDIAKR